MMKSVQNFISYLHEFLIFFLTFYLFLLRGNMFSGISKNWNFADMWSPPVASVSPHVASRLAGQRPSVTEWPVIKRARPTALSTAAPLPVWSRVRHHRCPNPATAPAPAGKHCRATFFSEAGHHASLLSAATPLAIYDHPVPVDTA
jgi:hypothetical protein